MEFVQYTVRINRIVSILTGGKKWLWYERDVPWNVQPHRWLLFKGNNELIAMGAEVYYTLGLSYYIGTEIIVAGDRVGKSFLQSALEQHRQFVATAKQGDAVALLGSFLLTCTLEIDHISIREEPPLSAKRFVIQKVYTPGR